VFICRSYISRVCSRYTNYNDVFYCVYAHQRSPSSHRVKLIELNAIEWTVYTKNPGPEIYYQFLFTWLSKFKKN